MTNLILRNMLKILECKNGIKVAPFSIGQSQEPLITQIGAIETQEDAIRLSPTNFRGPSAPFCPNLHHSESLNIPGPHCFS